MARRAAFPPPRFSSRPAPWRLLRSVATVGGYTMLSRLTGFARDMLIAALVGAGPVADAFFVAFKLPNFFRRLFAEGAFNAAFVPLFAGRLAAEGERGRARLRRGRAGRLGGDAAGLRDCAAARHAVADVRLRARLLRRPGEVRPRRHADAARLSLSAVHLAGVVLRRHAELARPVRRRRGDADPAQPRADRRADRACPLRADAGPRAGLGRRGGGRGAVRLARRRARAGGLPPAAAAAAPDAGREAPVRADPAGRAGRRASCRST